MDLSKYKSLYVLEVGEHLKDIEAALLSLEEGQPRPEVVAMLFRHFHSIKGMSASMGYGVISKVAHEIEEVLDGFRNRGEWPKGGDLDLFFEGFDALKSMVDMVDKGLPIRLDCASLVEGLKAVGNRDKARMPEKALAGPDVRAQILSLPKTMKVESGLFDDLLAGIGDLLTIKSGLDKLAEEQRNIELKGAVCRMDRSIKDIFGKVLEARMVPVEALTFSLPRVVRDISKARGKEVRFSIIGGDIKLDRMILDAVGDPIVHMIRNAIDHGIEPPDERVRLGKEPYGHVTMYVSRERDCVLVEISDDGRGMDAGRLKSRAVGIGLPLEKVEAMDGKEILMLACLPGLSLADEITEVSGRGVGMDVVKGQVESVGGFFDIESVPGKGTKMRMSLPLTVSIMKVLLVHLDNEIFALPMSRIIHVVEVGDGTNEVSFEGNSMPLRSLKALVGMDNVGGVEEWTAVIFRGERGQVALSIDGGSCEEIDAYISPLTPPFKDMRGISAFTTLGDGRLVFLLDIDELLE